MNGKLKAKKKLTKREKFYEMEKLLMHIRKKGGKPEKNIDDKKLF